MNSSPVLLSTAFAITYFAVAAIAFCIFILKIDNWQVSTWLACFSWLACMARTLGSLARTLSRPVCVCVCGGGGGFLQMIQLIPVISVETKKERGITFESIISFPKIFHRDVLFHLTFHPKMLFLGGTNGKCSEATIQTVTHV